MNRNHIKSLLTIKQMVIGVTLLVFVFGGLPAEHSVHAERLVKGQWTLPEHYPKGFHGYGYINRLAQDEVVIDDQLFVLAKSVVYATPVSEVASRADFNEGDLVGYLKNPRDEITSIWLVKRQER